MSALLLLAALAAPAQWTMSSVPPSGTLTAPLILTGDNASGTGTLRIRPSDEDTQLVLCEAGNNASPEVCGTVHHVNASATVSLTELGSNSYVDSAGAYQRYNTSFGAGTLFSQVGSTNSSNVLGGTLWSTNNTASGNWQLAVTGAGTSTFATGTVGTVTNDFRGPITNGGTSTCAGYNAGFTCITDNAALTNPSTASLVIQGTTDTAGYATVALHTSSNTGVGYFAYYGATQADADLADKVAVVGVGKTLIMARNDDVAAGSTAFQWMDNTGGTGATLMTLDGAGNLFLNASATRTKGTITLAAGTGTATVSSGCVPACVDTTANASVKCAVSGTTLTATGTGTDVIAYLCF